MIKRTQRGSEKEGFAGLVSSRSVGRISINNKDTSGPLKRTEGGKVCYSMGD